MAKTLMGATIRAGRIEAQFKFPAFGADQVSTKREAWPQDVVNAAGALLAVCDAQTPELDDVIQVQIYTPVTDPEGAANAGPGECVDINFRPGSAPEHVRCGDAAAVPAEVAAARDALKAAISAALNA